MLRKIRCGHGFRLLACMLALLFFSVPQSADAHRPDESYVYLIVDQGPLSGEIHVRISDMNKAVPLDANGDGTITEDEVQLKYDAIAEYLTARVLLIDGSTEHRIIPGEMTFFGPNDQRQMLLNFDVPTINPPPAELAAEYRFLYDGIDPIHRPMLLLKSNTRMRLVYNEAYVSLEFEPGADRQTVSLEPPSMGAILTGTVRQSFSLTLNNFYQLLIIVVALLGSLRWRTVAPDSTGSARSLGADAAFVAFTLGLGVASGFLVKDYVHFRVADHEMKNLMAAALGAVAASNLLIAKNGFRAIALFSAGALWGAVYQGYSQLVGLNKGFIEIVYPATVAGVFFAICVVAIVLLPLGAIFVRGSARADKIIRVSSKTLIVLAALFLFQRLVL